MKKFSETADSSRRKRARLFGNQSGEEEKEEEETPTESEYSEESESYSSGPNSERESENGEEPESSKAGDKSNTNDSMIVSLTNPRLLDCDICFNPLSAPVFQCKNGHIACSQCCKKLENKCPSCRLQTGSIRCRALETILESIRVSCQNTSHGCNETSMMYNQKEHHETTCIYSPCLCPFANCDYQSSEKQLALHLNEKHPDRLGSSFKYESAFPIKLDGNEEIIVIKEQQGDLFAITKDINYFFETTTVVVSHISGTAVQRRRHPYHLTARMKEPEGIIALKIHSFTRNHVPYMNNRGISPRASLVIPKDSLRQVRLSLCIHPST